MTQENNRHYYKSYTPNRTDSILGKRLKALMNRDGINQNQLAQELNVNKSTVSNWLKADNIKSEHLVSLAKYFGVTTDFLLGLTNNASPDYELRSITDLTGLSDKAITVLANLNHISSSDIEYSRVPATLNLIFENLDLLTNLYGFLTSPNTNIGEFPDPIGSMYLLQIQNQLLSIREKRGSSLIRNEQNDPLKEIEQIINFVNERRV